MTFTLNPKNPVEQALIKVLDDKRPVRIAPHRYVLGTDLIKELLLLGLSVVEQRYSDQIVISDVVMAKKEISDDPFRITRSFHSTIGDANSACPSDLAGTMPID